MQTFLSETVTSVHLEFEQLRSCISQQLKRSTAPNLKSRWRFALTSTRQLLHLAGNGPAAFRNFQADPDAGPLARHLFALIFVKDRGGAKLG